MKCGVFDVLKKIKVFSADVVNENSVDVIDECSIPDFGANVILNVNTDLRTPLSSNTKTSSAQSKV